jgi:hypothetical protein
MNNDGSTTLNLGALEIANQYSDYFGYDWVKVHSLTTVNTIWNAGSQYAKLQPCSLVSPPLVSIIEGS